MKYGLELRLLQSQMNPHFLYNTLDMVNRFAQEHGVEDISRIVRSLSDLNRTMFNQGRDFIEVEPMLRSLESYLYIQTFRYSSLVTYSVDADEGTRACPVLNPVVQPVVENAVVHGMGRRIERGHVSVRAMRDGDGICAEKIAVIRAGMESGSGEETSGLRYVQRRLRLVYGPAYGIQIWSEEGKGTRVDIVMPAAPRRVR